MLCIGVSLTWQRSAEVLSLSPWGSLFHFAQDMKRVGSNGLTCIRLFNSRLGSAVGLECQTVEDVFVFTNPGGATR